MILKSYTQFISEGLTGPQKAEKKLQKAMSKTDKFGKKQRAAEVEIDFRKNQLKYEREKERVEHDIKAVKDETSRGAAKDKLAKLKSDWKDTKKKALNDIKILRKG